METFIVGHFAAFSPFRIRVPAPAIIGPSAAPPLLVAARQVSHGTRCAVVRIIDARWNFKASLPCEEIVYSFIISVNSASATPAATRPGIATVKVCW
jgi:hypothetical protein